jgi:L-threonylcarbamoyladenylate synthase
MCLIKGKPEAIARYIRDNIQSGDYILAMEENLHFYEGLPVESMGKNAQEAAHRLFYLLRQMDERNAKRIFTETLPENGLGLAVMNRLARAASFHIVSV